MEEKANHQDATTINQYNWLPWFSTETEIKKLRDFAPTRRIRRGTIKAIKTPMLVEAILPDASIGEQCLIKSSTGRLIKSQVVGFDEDTVFLTPFDHLSEVGPGAQIITEGTHVSIPHGSMLLGDVVDCFGRSLSKPTTQRLETEKLKKVNINPMSRKRISKQLGLGIKALDLFTPVGEGQRLGIFSTAGQGKSTLLSMLAKSSTADVNVIALIGERGREVLDFVEDALGEEGRQKSVVIVATSDDLPMRRIMAAYTATAIAEHFRDQGKKVLLIMDSLTRFARALREIALSLGEPPARQGYPPSVFSTIPELLERAGSTEKGSITAFYSVLLQSEKLEDPLSEEVRAILDGHIYLDSSLANTGIFPAIDILKSNSRLEDQITSKENREVAKQLKRYHSIYEDNKDLITLGAYRKGNDADLDRAVLLRPKILDFVKQEVGERIDVELGLEKAKEILE
jgi:flagellum-specific ATP synthase